jgi:hypothetical protein
VRTIPRQRRYVSPTALTLCRPLLSFDLPRDAYVLRAVGRRFGPVLREDRRGQRIADFADFAGPERRRGTRRAEPDRGRVAV